jgi:lipid-binding SYLF domain-containing protein
MKATFLPIVLTAGLLASGCATAPQTASDRSDLHIEVSTAAQRMYDTDPDFQPFIHKAYGYVLFPEVGKGAVGAGGAYGRGEVYEQGRFVGYADLSQATLGVQLGGQSFSEAIAFESPLALQHFEAGKLTFAANASAVAMKSGAAASARYSDGVAVFVEPVGGLMFEAAIGGQSFSFQPSNEPLAEPNSGVARSE